MRTIEHTPKLGVAIMMLSAVTHAACGSEPDLAAIQDTRNLAEEEHELQAALTKSAGIGNDTVDPSLIGPDSAVQDHEEARFHDIGLAAKRRGLTFEEALARQESVEEVGDIAEAVAEKWPNAFVGSVMGKNPYGRPQLLVKGHASDELRDFVNGKSTRVEIVDNQPYSAIDFGKRVAELSSELKAMGYTESAVAYDIKRAAFVATARRGNDAVLDEEADAGLQDRFGAVDIAFTDTDVGSAHKSFGGMRVRIGADNACTSSWSVGILGIPAGVLTAGHCSNSIDGIRHGTATHGFGYMAQHLGSWGDFQMHSSTHEIVDDFYFDDNDPRDVSGVEANANITVGEDIDLYSPQQGGRFPSEVTLVGASINRGSYTVYNIVAMEDADSIPGDSGGGWSFGSKAYGVCEGNANFGGTLRGTFSVAALSMNALGYSVLY